MFLFLFVAIALERTGTGSLTPGPDDIDTPKERFLKGKIYNETNLNYERVKDAISGETYPSVESINPLGFTDLLLMEIRATVIVSSGQETFNLDHGKRMEIKKYPGKTIHIYGFEEYGFERREQEDGIQILPERNMMDGNIATVGVIASNDIANPWLIAVLDRPYYIDTIVVSITQPPHQTHKSGGYLDGARVSVGIMEMSELCGVIQTEESTMESVTHCENRLADKIIIQNKDDNGFAIREIVISGKESDFERVEYKSSDFNGQKTILQVRPIANLEEKKKKYTEVLLRTRGNYIKPNVIKLRFDADSATFKLSDCPPVDLDKTNVLTKPCYRGGVAPSCIWTLVFLDNVISVYAEDTQVGRFTEKLWNTCNRYLMDKSKTVSAVIHDSVLGQPVGVYAISTIYTPDLVKYKRKHFNGTLRHAQCMSYEKWIETSCVYETVFISEFDAWRFNLSDPKTRDIGQLGLRERIVSDFLFSPEYTELIDDLLLAIESEVIEHFHASIDYQNIVKTAGEVRMVTDEGLQSVFSARQKQYGRYQQLFDKMRISGESALLRTGTEFMGRLENHISAFRIDLEEDDSHETRPPYETYLGPDEISSSFESNSQPTYVPIGFNMDIERRILKGDVKIDGGDQPWSKMAPDNNIKINGKSLQKTYGWRMASSAPTEPPTTHSKTERQTEEGSITIRGSESEATAGEEEATTQSGPEMSAELVTIRMSLNALDAYYEPEY